MSDPSRRSDQPDDTEPLSEAEVESLKVGSGFTIDFVDRANTIGSLWDRLADDGATAPGAAPGDPTPFALRQLIGRGGQGDVWEAWQSSLRREVAVKIHRRGSADPFLHEAFVTAELDHPNIVPVFELGSIESKSSPKASLAMAMKRVRGERWDSLIARDHEREGGLDDAALARHLRVFADVCQAVAYAHSRGIAHLDLKPAQVIVGAFGEVYLMDWGMSARIDDAPGKGGRRARDIESPQGTPSYIAPELAFGDGDEIGAATDVYLLGATLHHVLTGRPPHPGASADEALAAARLNHVEPVPESAPSALRDLAARCLRTSPRERPATASEAREAVERFLGEAESRREGAELHRDAAERAESLDRLGYDDLAELEGKVSRALALHPGLAGARGTLDRLLARHAALAVKRGDLELARLTARQIDGEAAREESLAEADAAVAERSARERQRRRARRAAFAALGALACVLGFSSVFLRRSFREADDERKRAEAALASSREQLYRAELRAALSFAQDGDYPEARRALANAPREFRHWEWGLVASMASPELFRYAPQEARFNAIAVSNDAQTIAAIGEDGSARRFDAATGRALDAVSAPNGGRFEKIAPAGEGFLFWSRAGALAGLGVETPTISTSPSPLVAAAAARGSAYEEEGLVLYVAREDGSVARFADGSFEDLPMWGTGSVAAFSASDDGRYAAVGGEDGAVAIYDAEAGTWTVGAEKHARPVKEIAWRPGGSECVSIAPEPGVEQPEADARSIVWRAGEAAPAAVLDGGMFAPLSVAWTPSGNALAVGLASGTVWQYDAEGWNSYHRFYCEAGLPLRLSFSPDGRRLAVSARRDVFVFEWEQLTFGRTVRVDSRETRAIAATGEGIVATGDDGGLALWSYLESAHTAYWNTYGDRFVSLDMARAASTLVGARASGAIEQLQAGDAPPRQWGSYWHESATPRVRCSADGGRIVSFQSGGTLRRETVGGGKTLGFWTTPLDAPAIDVAIDPAGELVAWSDEAGAVRVGRFDDPEIAPVGHWKDPSDPATALLFSNDATTLYAGRRSGAIEAIPLAGTPSALFEAGHKAEISRLTLSADGASLASGSADKSARVWSVGGRSSERAFSGSHADTVTAAILSPDGQRLFTSCMDGGVRVFDRERGVELLVLRQHRYGVLDLALDPRGRWLFSLGREGHLRTWIPLPWPDESALGLPAGAPPSEFARRRGSWTP